MKNTVIVLLVVALIVLVIGAVNQDQRVDLDYVFGTWRDVSIFTLSAIVAGASVVVGVVIGLMARADVAGDRRKLERELSEVYPRLREAERAAGLPEWRPERPSAEETATQVAAGAAVAATTLEPGRAAGGEDSTAAEEAGAEAPAARPTALPMIGPTAAAQQSAEPEAGGQPVEAEEPEEAGGQPVEAEEPEEAGGQPLEEQSPAEAAAVAPEDAEKTLETTGESAADEAGPDERPEPSEKGPSDASS